MKLIKSVAGKKIFKLEEAAQLLGVDVETVKDLIDCGDLTGVGSMKNLVRFADLYKFNYGHMFAENEERHIDLSGNQRYHYPYSVEVKNLSHEEWENMKKNGIKELSPYWNESRAKWCLALSLGYDEKHKRIRKVLTATSQQELWVKYGEFQSENKVLHKEDNAAVIASAVAGEHKHPKADMLFKDYLIEYLGNIEGGERSRTFGSKVNSARHILEGLGDYRLGEINKDVLRRFINGLTKKTYEKGGKVLYFSQSSINKIYDVLHGVIKAASDEDGDKILKIDFMASIKKPRSNAYKDKEPQALSRDEFKRISDVVKDNRMINAWVHIMMYTGARPSEALALKFSDVDYQKMTIKICKTLSHKENHEVETQKRKGPYKPIITDLKNEHGKSKVNYQKRILKISKNLLDIIKDWEDLVKGNTELMEMKRINGTEEFMFCGSKGQMWLYRDYRQAYERILKKAGLNISEFNPYRFRHSYCTESLRNGIDVKTVQLMMGDNTVDMVLKVYANMNKDDILKGSEIFAEGMDGILYSVEE